MLNEKGVMTWLVTVELQVLTGSFHTVPMCIDCSTFTNLTGWLGFWDPTVRR